MYTALHVFVALSVLGAVVGILHVDNLNKTETESKTDIEVNINKIFNKWESKFLEKIITYINSEKDAVKNTIPQLEEKIIQTLNISNKKIEEKLDASNNQIHVLEVKITETLDSMKKELLELNRTLTHVYCNKLPPFPHGLAELLNGTRLLGSVVQYSCSTNYRLVGPTRRTCTEDFQWSETAPTCEVDCGKLPPLLHGSAELLNGTTHLGSVVQYSCATNYRLMGPARRTCTEDFQWSETAPTCEGLPCKEEAVVPYGNTPQYSFDNVSLHHYGTLRRDSTGHLTYMELHFAAQTDHSMGIGLSEKEDFYAGIRYELFAGENIYKRTRLLHNGYTMQNVLTPDIISSTQFSSFYIKIDDGKLLFGKEGGAPLISLSGDDLGSLNYYRFTSGESTTIFHYCPDAVEGSEDQ